MSPRLRRITYSVGLEGCGILLSALFLLAVSRAPFSDTLSLSVFASTIALAWAYLFNTAFEAWEARQTVRGRSFRRRSAHAALFEVSLSAILLPATAWFLGVGVLQALGLEVALILFFLVYTWAFTWGFDRLFGLPESAK